MEGGHAMCDTCFADLRDQAFERLIQLDALSELPVSIKEIRERLQAGIVVLDMDPEVEALRTKAAKYLLARDFPRHYKFKG
ncbi:hypothetical protein EFBL_1457 [Effusibacillus lacus]|uniref:Uncharacterized protein n=1 Tax=Effusibacillus lacus TaxID=1348429 RepID=A0A292YD65_9BACL|nr:hypothetical protein EFBL_1457 [Effusibacillus lacus]